MLNDFLAFIERNNLFISKDRIILAVSGGVDSVVMAKLFNGSAYDFAIAHCNFKLRGSDSDKDEEFVNKLAENMGVPFFSQQFDTKKYASSHNLSTQVAARELRYQWFSKLMEAEGYQYVATAHHRNDSLETVLYNLTKGTGIHGITGVPIKNDQIIRPLLFTDRESIEAYARENKIKWREDISNQSNDYHRNLIRNEVVPILKKINPGLEKTFEHTLARLQGVEEVLHAAVDAFKSKHVKEVNGDVFYTVEGLEHASIALIDELFKSYGFTFSQIEDLKKALKSTGKLFYAGGMQLLVDRQFVILSKRNQNETVSEQLIEQGQTLFENDALKLSIANELMPISFEKGVEKFDAAKLNYPLKVRKWKEGDYFYPLGMKGKKKLSDFMIDNKIPLNLKERVYVLESDKKIVWVIGYRVDDRFKVTPDTKQVVSFRLQA